MEMSSMCAGTDFQLSLSQKKVDSVEPMFDPLDSVILRYLTHQSTEREEKRIWHRVSEEV